MVQGCFSSICDKMFNMNGKQVDISTQTLVRFWLVIIGLALALGAIWLARDAVIMILIAFFLAVVLNRPVVFFAKVLPGNSRALGATVSFLISLVVLIGIVTLILPIFLEQTIVFAQSLPDTISALENHSRSFMDFAYDNGFGETISSALGGLATEGTQYIGNLGSVSLDFMTGLFDGMMKAFLVLVLTFFMLVEGPNWLGNFWKYAYRDSKKREHHKQIATKMYDVVSTFVTSQIIVAAINAALAGIGVFVLALTFGFTMSLILPIASIVFVSTFIPVFGPFIGGALTGLLVLLYNPIAAIIFVVYLTLFQQVVYNLLSPKIQGKRMHMSALVVLAAMIVGLQVWGIFGALVAIPIAGCVVVVIRETLLNRSNSKTTPLRKKK